MKFMLYEDWYKKRLAKIVNIFGKEWFQQKQVLELGACCGDFGIELLKLGSNVCFIDAREQNINEIKHRLQSYSFNPDVIELDQNYPYNLEKKFDLVLHLGTLYHIEKWQQDLESALSHSNVMILESKVNPIEGAEDSYVNEEWFLGTFNCLSPIFTQESVEKKLTNMGCKFIRFDDPNLNSGGWLINGVFTNHIYDWTYNQVQKGMYDTSEGPHSYHFRRFWLVLK